jgi:serine protease inhibitor
MAGRRVAALVLGVALVLLIALLAVSQFRSGEVAPPVVVAGSLSLEDLVARVNGFTLNLYGLLLDSGGNVVVSPFNVYIALTMLYEGSSSTTREELGKAMGLDGGDACRAYQQLLSMLPVGSGGNTTLYVANGAWLREGFPFKEDYVSRVRECFESEVRYFKPGELDALVGDVNGWVSERTNGLIRELLSRSDVDDRVVAVLISVVYFKSLWLREFEPYGEIDFWTGRDRVKVKAMEVEGRHLKVVRGKDYVAVEIPYRDTSISMVVVMPEDFTNIKARYRELLQEALSRIDEARPGAYVHLAMPRFNITFKSELKGYLEMLGIREAFKPGVADLTRMAHVQKGDLYVDKVVHQTVIKVNEKGTEAAAATAVIAKVLSQPLYQEEVIINKPFIFIVRDRESKIILFIGHVINPSET